MKCNRGVLCRCQCEINCESHNEMRATMLCEDCSMFDVTLLYTFARVNFISAQCEYQMCKSSKALYVLWITCSIRLALRMCINNTKSAMYIIYTTCSFSGVYYSRFNFIASSFIVNCPSIFISTDLIGNSFRNFLIDSIIFIWEIH